MHENKKCPPALSDRGRLCLGTKLNLITCLMKATQMEGQSSADAEELSNEDIEACLQGVAEEEPDNCPSLEVTGIEPDITAALQKSASEAEPPSTFDMKVADGAAIVHFTATGVSMFEEYAHVVFLPYLRNQLNSVQRQDVVWDKNSIKVLTRKKKGKGTCRKVKGQKIPVK